ncbi:hypothetical protein DV735_g4338, partial [Chaetothyriales sp. CBS 134920]
MPKQEILFLSPRTGDPFQPSAQKDEPSIAKSHAARVSQNRAKKQRNKTKTAAASQIASSLKREQELRLIQSIGPLPPLYTSLRTGNSDPFASSTVEVTPRVNELIHFFRSFYGDRAYQPHLSPESFRADFMHKTVDIALQGRTSAQAFLSSMMTLRSCLSPEDVDLERDKARLNKEALLTLHTDIEENGLGSSQVLLGVKFRFMAAAFEGNIIEATMQGNMAKEMLYRNWSAGRQSVDVHEFIYLTFVDGQLALKHLTRTILDLHWIDDVFKPLLTAAEPLIQPIWLLVNADLDPAIDHLPLRSLFGRARVAGYLIPRPMQNTKEGRSVELWLGVGSGTIQARVANYYCTVQRELSRPDLSAPDRFIWLTRAAIALALGTLISSAESMAFYQVRIPGGDRITAKLIEIITQIPVAASSLSQNFTRHYQDVHLWTYFICAQNEQRELQKPGALPAYQHSPTAFFGHIFAAQASRMHLSQWQQVRASLERVLYYDTRFPNGAFWVDDAIRQLSGQTGTSTFVPQEQQKQETLLRKTLGTVLLPYYFLTSRTAIKAYLTTILFLVASTVLVGVSSAAYLIFYYNYIPPISLTKTLHLQYGIDKYPFAAVALEPGALISQQPYDIDVLLQMPRTPTNLGAGNFMIDVQLLGRYNPLAESERALTSLLGNITLPSISGLTTLSHSRRPAILPYQSPALHYAQAALRLPLHLVGLQDLDSNTLRIPIFESVSFPRGLSSVPTHVRLELQAKGPVATGLGPGIASPEIPLQVYSSKIEFSARFQGLRYVVYRYRIFSFFVFTTLFYGVSLLALVVMWTAFSFIFGRPSDTGEPIKQERSSAQPESDVSIKQEPEDQTFSLAEGGGAVSSVPTAQQYIRAGETADDEEGTEEDINTDGDNDDDNVARDSGIGTSMESGRKPSGLSVLFTFLLALAFLSTTARAAVLGIDLGTEYIKTAIAKPGSPIDIVLTRDSKRKEAATLAFKPSRAQANDPDALPERLYGGDATALASRFPADVYPNLKALLGVQPDSEAARTYKRRYPGLRLEPVSRYSDEQTTETVGFVSKSAGEKTEPFMVEELLAMQLKNIKANAQAGLPKGVFAYDAVITYPAFWTAEERRAIELAADLAGIHLLGLISDGLAVGLNYATGRTFESVTDGAAPEHHVVFDVGAGSTTATVLRFQGRTIKGAGKRNQTIQEVQVLGTGFDSTLGGDALNDVIVADMLSEFAQQPKVQQRGISENDFLSNPKAIARIWKEAERIRQVLSANSASSASFEDLLDDLSLKYSLTRERFETLSKSIAARVEGPLIRALDAAGISLSEINSVILHGGAGRTPFVQKALETAVGVPDKIKANVNADEAAAMGAAFRAASLAPSFRVKDIRGLDVGGLTVSLDYTADGKDRSQKLFTPQSVIGAEKHVPVKTLEDVNLSFADLSSSEPVRITTVETTNLTKSVAQLKDKHDCAAANISSVFVVRLSPLDGLPEVRAATVSCKSERGKEGNVLDNVKGLFGFGSKKDTEQAPLGEESTDDTDSASESPIEATDSSSTSTGSASASESTDTPAASSSASKAAKSEPTTVVVPVGLKTNQVRFSKPSADSLTKIRTRLSEFDSSDRRAVQRVEALNTLEAFTYRARDYLDDAAFIAVSSEQARQKLQEHLSATSEWLYGEGMDAKLQDFKNKLKELEALVEPVLTRKEENSKREDGVIKLKEALESLENLVKLVQGQLEKDAALSASSTASAASEHIASPSSSRSQDDDLDDDPYSTSADAAEPAATPPAFEYKEEDLLSLTNTQTTAKQWLDEKLALQEKLGPYDDPAVRVAELESKAQEIQTLVSDTLMKSFKFEKPKKEKASKKAKGKSSRTKKTSSATAEASSSASSPSSTSTHKDEL